MSASRSGSRSNQRSARLRMFSVATWSRSIGLPRDCRLVGQGGGAMGSENENVLPIPSVEFDPDPAPVLLDDVAGDGQAEPRPAGLAADPRPVHLVEPFEDARLGGLRDADPMVGHRHDDVRRRRADRDVDLAAVRAELHGVVEQVDEDLAEAVAVAADRRDRLGDIDAEGHALAIGEQAQALGRVDRDPADVEQVDDAEGAAALDPRQVEQLVDHLDEVAGLDLDLVDPVAHPGRDGVAGRLGLAGQRLGQQADRRQRRPQLVRQVVDELGADLLEPAQLGDVLDDEPQAARRHAPGPDARAAGRPRPRPRSPRSPSPTSSAVRASASTWTVMNASMSVRPTRLPGRTPRSVWAAGLAATIRRSSSTISTPSVERTRRSPTGRAGSADLELRRLTARSRSATTAAAASLPGRRAGRDARAGPACATRGSRRTTRRRAR